MTDNNLIPIDSTPRPEIFSKLDCEDLNKYPLENHVWAIFDKKLHCLGMIQSSLDYNIKPPNRRYDRYFEKILVKTLCDYDCVKNYEKYAKFINELGYNAVLGDYRTAIAIVPRKHNPILVAYNVIMNEYGHTYTGDEDKVITRSSFIETSETEVKIFKYGENDVMLEEDFNGSEYISYTDVKGLPSE